MMTKIKHSKDIQGIYNNCRYHPDDVISSIEASYLDSWHHAGKFQVYLIARLYLIIQMIIRLSAEGNTRHDNYKEAGISLK